METNKSRSRKPTLRMWADDLIKEVDNIVEKLKRGKVAITEDVLFLLIFKYLKASQSRIFRNVSHNVGKGDWAYYFAPDADLLEFRPDGTVIGYELKGFQKVKNNYELPGVYVGLDQALAYLRNPCIIDSSGSISCTGESIFDFVYLVHASTDVNRFDEGICAVIDKCTPIGFILVNYSKVREVVRPKGNPFLNKSLKDRFLNNLIVLDTFKEFKLKLPISL